MKSFYKLPYKTAPRFDMLFALLFGAEYQRHIEQQDTVFFKVPAQLVDGLDIFCSIDFCQCFFGEILFQLTFTQQQHLHEVAQTRSPVYLFGKTCFTEKLLHLPVDKCISDRTLLSGIGILSEKDIFCFMKRKCFKGIEKVASVGEIAGVIFQILQILRIESAKRLFQHPVPGTVCVVYHLRLAIFRISSTSPSGVRSRLAISSAL